MAQTKGVAQQFCLAGVLVVLALVAVALAPQPVAAQQFYHLESAVQFKSSDTSWDYLNFEWKRSYLYIARRKDGVTVYDVAAKRVVANIERTERANGVVLVEEFDRGYSSNEDGTTTVFQLSTLKTMDRIKFGADADGNVYEPTTKQVVFMLADSKTIAFLDAKTGGQTGTLQVESSKLESPTADGQGNLFVAQRDKNSVIRIDARQRKVTAEWKAAGCDEPTGLGMDVANKRLFVGCRGKNPVLAVLDSQSGGLITTLEIGRGNDDVIYDPDSRKIYTSNGVDANLIIIDQVDPSTYKLSEALGTRPGARTMALDPTTKKVYLVTAEGTVDPSRKVNRAVAPFYANRFFPDTFTLLTYSR